MKRIFASFVAFVLCIAMMSSLCLAAPETIGAYDSPGVSGIITITNPDKLYSTTYSKACSVSGFAEPGAKIYVYSMDLSTGNYKLCVEDDNVLSVTAGASGMFVIPLKLSAGSNNIIIRAEKDGSFQNTELHINVLSASLFSIKSSLKAFKFN